MLYNGSDRIYYGRVLYSMSKTLLQTVSSSLADIKQQGLYKHERLIRSPQDACVAVAQGALREHSRLVNLCANNYLGLANHPRLIKAAKQALDAFGFGMASVRFICGTQTSHRDLEVRLARFLAKDDSILFSSCFDANTGFFEALLGPDDAVISDQLNHASIIDGVRLCKARRFRYANNDMADLEAKLRQTHDMRHRVIVSDGVFSMDGYIADLPGICALAEAYDALVMVDDSHAVGFMGARGAGTPEYCDVEAGVHILSGTFGKALGGASGGYVAGPQPIIDLLRQRARPYLFSNSLAPSIVAATLEALDMVSTGGDLRAKLFDNAAYFRARMADAGFTLAPGEHPIVPIMIGDAQGAQALAAALEARGIFVTAFSYPVVPKGRARIRTQLSAAHSREQLDKAVTAFIDAGKTLGLLP